MPQLTWEKKYEANVGVDIGVFQNRVTLSVDGYYRKSLDLISLIRTSGIGGQALKAANYADLKSQGIEFSLGGVPFVAKDLRWESNLIFSYNTNEITRAENFPILFDLIVPEGGAKVGLSRTRPVLDSFRRT